MKLALVLVVVLVSAARADRKEPAHHKQARTFLRTLLETDKPPTASAAKPLELYMDESEGPCKKVPGKIVDAAGMTKLKPCLGAFKKRAGDDKIDEIGATDIRLAAFLDNFPPQVKNDVKAMAKNSRLVQFGFNGDGETISFTLAVARDGTIRSLFVTSEPIE